MEDSSRPVTGYPAPNPNPNPNGYSAHPPPAAAAYPYPAAHYANFANPYYQQNYQPDPTATRRATLLRRILALVIGLVVIFAAITFIVWLVLRPQLPQFRVDSLTLSNLTIGNDSLLSVAAVVRLTARNPNHKMALSYDHVAAEIYYRSWSLSDTMIPPFSQETKNVTSLTARFAAAGRFVDKAAADRVESESRNNGNVVFNLRMLSRVRFKAKAWRPRRRFLKVFCGDLVVGVPANGRPGTFSGGPRQCRVGT